MITILERNFVGFGIYSGVISTDPYIIRWLLPCGHMLSDWKRDCRCDNDKQ